MSTAIHFAMRSRWCLVIVSLWMLCASGCSEDPPPPPAPCFDTICEPFESTCLGEITAVCDSDGRGWSYTSCAAGGQYCSGVGVCKSRACLNPGRGLSCIDDKTAEQCSASGDQIVSQSCAENQSCLAGYCLADACTDGAVLCGDAQTLVTCNQGTWAVQPCGGAEICSTDSGVASCEPQVCTPSSAWCDEGVSMQCNAFGTKVTRVVCRVNQSCKEGFCQDRVCGVDLLEDGATPTAGLGGSTGAASGVTEPQDGGPSTPAAATSGFSFRMSGIIQDFDLAAVAYWDKTESRLFIGAEKNQKRVLIQLSGVEGDISGSWPVEDDPTGARVIVCYDDGVDDSSPDGDCPEGYTHASTVYDVTVSQNDGPGGRVKGSFSATLESSTGAQVQFTDGVFDVAYQL